MRKNRELWIICFVKLYSDHLDLHKKTHAFPTRRTSDHRMGQRTNGNEVYPGRRIIADIGYGNSARCLGNQPSINQGYGLTQRYRGEVIKRSEEHTSELQSLMRIPYAVFCLQTKKTATIATSHQTHYSTPSIHPPA